MSLRPTSWGLISFAFRRRGHDHLLAPKVPETRHVEGHVGDDHQVFEEGKQGVDWRTVKQRDSVRTDGRGLALISIRTFLLLLRGIVRDPPCENPIRTLTLTSRFTVLVVASEEVISRRTAAAVHDEQTRFPSIRHHFLREIYRLVPQNRYRALYHKTRRHSTRFHFNY